jgi:hypothetical protein
MCPWAADVSGRRIYRRDEERQGQGEGVYQCRVRMRATFVRKYSCMRQFVVEKYHKG